MQYDKTLYTDCICTWRNLTRNGFDILQRAGEKMFRVNAALCYHKGSVREGQEDNFFFRNAIGTDLDHVTGGFQELLHRGSDLVLGVFDGMGGLRYGEEASYAAANVLAQKKKNFWNPINETWFRDCIREMNNQVYQRSIKRGCSIGTTAAMLKFGCRKVVLCNVGDSRIYRHRNDVLEQLSQDHSDQEILNQIGVNRKASLLQFIGMPEDEIIVEPTVLSVSYQPGDRFVLCSDGLTDMTSEEEINEICRHTASASECAKQLVQKALANGGKDNVTVIVADVLSTLFSCRKCGMEENA